MMNFGPMSGGFGEISSSSSSNLSALAPPFTVDRLNPNFNSNPLLHYSDSRYAADPFNLKWHYVPPSAPGPELVTDSTGDAGVHISDGYRFSASSSVSPSSGHWSAPSPGTKASGSAFTYGGAEINPYYSSYVPPLVGEDNSLVPNQGSHYNVVPTSGMSHASQVDYTQSSFDLEYGPRWLDSLGVKDGNRAKRVEVEGSFMSSKGNVGGSGIHNQLGQGGYNMGTRNKEASDFSYQRTEFHAGVGYLENKDFGQTFGFFPNDLKKPNVLGPSSMYKDSHPLIPSSEIHNDVSNYQSSYTPYDNDISKYQSSYTPYDKNAGPANTSFPVPPSVMRSAPTVVIRPPPAINVDFTVSRKPSQGNNGEGVRIVDLGHSNSSKQQGNGIESSCKISEDNSGTDLINFSKRGDGIVTSTSVKELSSVLDSTGTLDHKMDTKFVPQLPDLIVSGGTAAACDDNVTSDFVDALNLGVDSPCWKGAPYSKISQFDVEAGHIKNIEKKFDDYPGFDPEPKRSLYSIIGSDGVPSERTVQGSVNNQNENGRTNGVLRMERTLDTLSTSNEQSLLDAKSNVQISTATNVKGVKIGSDAEMLRRKSASQNDVSGFDVKECNTNYFVDEEGAGIAPIHASEGADVAVHAAEKVLDSPVSEDDAIDHPKLPDPKLSMPTVIKTMHNLSELLLFYHLNHAIFVDGENIETLKHIKSNIDSCLSKKVIQASDKLKSDKPVGDTSEKVGESCNVEIISESHTTNETVNPSVKLNSGSMHGGVETCGASGGKIKAEKLLKLSPFMDDVDMTRDDDMAKAIKKVLEENFHSDEEMHSQAAPLYKNLWLEAEAKLCSISYKARFDRMKMQMEDAKFKVSQPQASNAQPKTGDGTIPKPTIQDCGHTGDIEASVMERFNILKSREENPKPVNMEEEQGTEMVDGVVMASFDIPKFHEGSSKLNSISEGDEEEPKRIDGEHAPSVMARFNVLKSRDASSNSVSVGNEPPPEAVDGNTAEGIYGMQYIRGQPENVAFDMARVPHFQYHTGIGLDEGRFGSFGEEFHLPVKNDAAARFFHHSNIRRQGSSGSHDGSSDWEHVRKDDVSWKTHE